MTIPLWNAAVVGGGSAYRMTRYRRKFELSSANAAALIQGRSAPTTMVEIVRHGRGRRA